MLTDAKKKKSRFVHINFKVMFIPFTTCCFLKLSYTLPRYLRSISKWPLTLIHHFSLRKSSVIDHLFKWTAIKYFPKYYNFPKCISIWKNLTQDHDTLDQYPKSLLIVLRQLKVLNLCWTLRTKLFDLFSSTCWYENPRVAFCQQIKVNLLSHISEYLNGY